jgi:hypothetical protein
MKELLRQGSRKSTLIRAIGSILALALLVYVLSQQGWEAIKASIQQIALWRLVLAFGLVMVSRFMVSARWHVLLRSADIQVRYRDSTQITFAGLFATNFLPTTIGGDVVRLAAGVRLKFDTVICAASLVVDRLVGMAGMATAVPLGLPSLLGAFPPAALASFSVAGRWQRLRDRAIGLLQRLLGALRVWLAHPVSLLLAFAASWVHMLCTFGAIDLILKGMDESLSFWVVGGLYSIVYFMTLIPISINGYGLQEISMAVVLSRAGGVTLANALTAALLFRTLVMLASLPGAVFLPQILLQPGQPAETAAALKPSYTDPADPSGENYGAKPS